MSVRSRVLVLLCVVAVCSVGITWWLGHDRSNQSVNVVTDQDQEQSPASLPDVPKPAKTGPFPKVVVDNRVHNFGLMEHNKEGSHLFTIRNDGEAVLQLYANPKETSCQCTVGTLRKTRLEPGESTELEVKWSTKSTGQFSHSAIVRTNDPKNSDFRLTVAGWVSLPLRISPTGSWSLGTIKDKGTHEVTGYLLSDVADSFEITGIETSTPLLTAKWTPLSQDRLAEFVTVIESDEGYEEEAEEAEAAESESEGKAKERPIEIKPPVPKCGYQVTTELAPGCPIGAFREQLTIATNIEGIEPETVYIEGNRPGPIQVVATGGVYWMASRLTLKMGRFAASEGKTGSCSLFMDDVPGGLELKVVDVDPDVIQFDVQRDPSFQGLERVRFLVKITVPPGAEPMVCTSENVAKVLLTTNHPAAKSIPLKLEFVSF